MALGLTVEVLGMGVRYIAFEPLTALAGGMLGGAMVVGLAWMTWRAAWARSTAG